MPPPDIFLQLIDDSKDVPLMFAIMLPSGFIFLQEFSNALTSIKWNPILPVPVDATAEPGSGGAVASPSSLNIELVAGGEASSSRSGVDDASSKIVATRGGADKVKIDDDDQCSDRDDIGDEEGGDAGGSEGGI